MSRRTNRFVRNIRKNRSKILKGVGFTGMFVSQILTIPATVKAVRACDKRKEELGVEKLPVKEIIKTSWKCYIPSILITSGSAAGMITGESIDLKNTKLISATCKAAEQTFADYRNETVKQIGEKQSKEIESNVLSAQAEQVKPSESFLIQGSENGGTLFYEPVTGTFFYSTRNKVDKAFNDLSAQMIRENYVDLGDLFDYIGLKKVDACYVLGWNSCKSKTVVPKYYWSGVEETMTPYVIMSYEVYPTTDFDKY